MNTKKKLIKSLIPPVIFDGIKKIMLKKTEAKWNKVANGILKDREFYCDPALHKDFLDGTYDKFFWDYIVALELKGKTIFEIGGHIGYHALTFAELVGAAGKVYAFEPNPYNRERFRVNLSKNPDLANRIQILDFAVSSSNEEIELNFSSSVDDGKSSGSFINGSHTPLEATFYDEVGFEKTMVKALRMDDFKNSIMIESDPFLIKIDVEGAESLVLNGGLEVIKKHRPIVLMEIHSICNMLMVYEFFKNVNYSISLLKEELDGRCFIAANPGRE